MSRCRHSRKSSAQTHSPRSWPRGKLPISPTVLSSALQMHQLKTRSRGMQPGLQRCARHRRFATACGRRGVEMSGCCKDTMRALRKREIGRVGCSTASRRPGGLYMTCMAQATRNPCCNLDENNLQTPSFGYWTQVYSPNPKPSPGSLQYVRVPHLSLSSNAPTSTSSSWLITPILCGLR